MSDTNDGRLIAVKIDVTKIKKEWLFQGKNGAKYLDVLLRPKQDDFGNDFSASQSVPKEHRAENKWGPFIGSAKYLGTPSSGQQQARPSGRPAPATAPAPAKAGPAPKVEDPEDDVPF